MRAAPSPRRTDGRPPFLFYPLTLRRIKKSAENRKNVGKKVYICTVETKHRLDYDNETRVTCEFIQLNKEQKYGRFNIINPRPGCGLH